MPSTWGWNHIACFWKPGSGIEGSQSPVCSVRKVATRTYNDNYNAHFSFLPLRPPQFNPESSNNQAPILQSRTTDSSTLLSPPQPTNLSSSPPLTHYLSHLLKQTLQDQPRHNNRRRSPNALRKCGGGTHVETRDPGENESFERALGWGNSQEGYGGLPEDQQQRTTINGGKLIGNSACSPHGYPAG